MSCWEHVGESHEKSATQPNQNARWFVIDEIVSHMLTKAASAVMCKPRSNSKQSKEPCSSEEIWMWARSRFIVPTIKAMFIVKTNFNHPCQVFMRSCTRMEIWWVCSKYVVTKLSSSSFKLLRLPCFLINLFILRSLYLMVLGNCRGLEVLGGSELSVFVYLLCAFALSNFCLYVFYFVSLLKMKCFHSLSWFLVQVRYGLKVGI